MPQERLYRTGAGYPVMIAWTVIITVAFLFTALNLSRATRREQGPVLWALGGVAVLLGPLCLGVYLLRRYRVYVRIDDEKGLIVSGKAILEWDRIRKVEAVPGLLGRGTQREPVRLSKAGRTYVPESFGEALDRAADEPRSMGIFIFFLLAPIVSIFTPWHPRVVVTLKDTRRLIFHELERDLEFCLRCVPRLRERGRPEGHPGPP